jgi:hypothetical protein
VLPLNPVMLGSDHPRAVGSRSQTWRSVMSGYCGVPGIYWTQGLPEVDCESVAQTITM